MDKFKWQAVDAQGNLTSGQVEAVDSRAVAEWLSREGYTVVSVSRVKWPPTNYHFETIGRRDLIHFTYKYLPLVASRITVDRALEILRGEIKKHRVKNALVSIKRDMHNGSAMSQAMSRHPDIFDNAYVSAVRAGEQSGRMDKSLSMMGSYLEWLDKVARQMWAAITYPIVVLVAMGILAGVLAFFVIPVFKNLYERLALQVDLPLPTEIVFAVSHLVRSYWFVPLAVVVGLIVLFVMRNRIPGLQLFIHKAALKLPIIGGLTRQLQALQFCRFFQLLHASGVATQKALEEARGVMTNIPMIQSVKDISRRLEAGMSLGEAFHQSSEFPTLVAEQIRVGEESGNVAESLEYICRYYDAELDYSMRRFTGVLGPALIVVLAVFILFLALSFYLPLFEIANQIQ